ncbi:TRAF-like superfamily protein [Striga hermonthica]|uniref:TRAF-like superfamily protein n=1 Tax=Striga hermonthica TaxID=68872 RepID=A0A9N7MDK9_STRHE|nr:TRAF-like superfamily protein [Striga hermonthica]
MARVAIEESGVGKSSEGVSNGQQQQIRTQSGEEITEWRSLDQVENGSPSTSPPYWDIDDDEDDDGGQKPSDLYGKHTWKIDKFSQISKRELRSDTFEAGGYRWYILIYPQGCDVCNHLSLFLCVANHDKLLPGWSHFAQFTIAVVNKDPKKSKYSDTLHRFWKKEHDWGWKKFMELSKLLDGFIDADTLIIKAQVQVIRERADRPFRCLDCQYRRELVRVYLTNVEQICRRFVEEHRAKLGKLIEDKDRWSSFRAFWLGMDQSSRRCMSREKSESILKVVVKHFFIEKEVTSTLVMDSLYSGLKTLEAQNKGKNKKGKGKYLEAEELSVPIVHIEKDTFALVDDVLLLLERAAVEPLPPKDEKDPQNRTKDGTAGEDFNKDSVERDEKRLTELGRRTIEIFVLTHIFRKIEVAYQEEVALKKQEELIREEEAAWLADLEQKARRGVVDKEKKSKKKQGKLKRNSRKGKDKGRDEKSTMSTGQDKIDEDGRAEMKELAAVPEIELGKSEVVEDVSDVSDSADYAPELPPQELEDRDVSPVNSDTDNSEVQPPMESGSCGNSGVVQNGMESKGPSVVDDSSSACSSDSAPSSVASVAHNGKLGYHNNQNSPSRGWNQKSKLNSGSTDWVNVGPSQPVPDARHSNDASQSTRPQAPVQSLPDRVANDVQQKVGKKDDESRSFQRNLSGKGPSDANSCSKSAACVMSPPRSPSKITPLISHLNLDTKADIAKPAHTTSETSNPHKFTTPKPAVNTSGHQRIGKLPTQEAPVQDDKTSSRPLSARPAVSAVQTASVLARSVSAAGRLGPEPSNAYASQSYSYRNAIISGTTYSQNPCATSIVNSYSQAPSQSHLFQQRAEPNLSLGITSHPKFVPNVESYNPGRSGPQDHIRPKFPVGQGQGQAHAMPDEFPHLDIINDLLDDEQCIGNGMVARVDSSGYESFGGGPHYLNRHYSFPSDPEPAPSCRYDRSLLNEGNQHGRMYDAVRDMILPAQLGTRPYLLDAFVPGQWQMGGGFVSARNNMESDGGDYPYRIPEYTNPTVGINGINGYTAYRPSNGL